jgi:4-amino-4-deoxy-L-arabinose transferase-like glycosyltransferase
MSPLAVLVALLPGLWALGHTTLTETSALQGLRGLALFSADSADAVVDPDASFADLPLRWQPPLMTALTALGLRLGDASQFYTLQLAPYVCTAGVIALAYLLARNFGGARMALFTALLLGCHPLTLHLVQTAVPLSAAILIALLCLWAVYNHLQENAGAVSLKLLVGGIGLGACMLASGSLSIAVWILLGLHVLTRESSTACAKRGFVLRKANGSDRAAWKSQLALAATAFAVGGWWVLMMTSRYGGEFFIGWLSGVPVADWATERGSRQIQLLAGARSVCEALASLLLIQIGLVAIGLTQAVRALWNCSDEPRRHANLLLLTWTAVSIVVWALAESAGLGEEPVRDLWKSFVLIPLLMLAALGMREIIDRRVSLGFVLAMLLLTFANVAWHTHDVWGVTGKEVTDAGLLAGLLLTLILGARYLTVTCCRDDVRQRAVLSSALIALLVASCGVGLYSARRTQPQDQELALFRKDLRKLKNVAGIAFISPLGVPPQLRYLVRSLWPRTPVQRLVKWELAVAPGSAEALLAEHQTQLLVCWSLGEVIRPRTPTEAAAVAPVGTPKIYQGRDLAAYSVGASGQ